jgi:hypothetical protein
MDPPDFLPLPFLRSQFIKTPHLPAFSTGNIMWDEMRRGGGFMIKKKKREKKARHVTTDL